jgi:hypothetical protein
MGLNLSFSQSGFAIFKLGLGIVFLSLSACSRLADCVDTVLMESPSPDGLTVAVVLERDCGATTAKNTQVCFRRAQDVFDPKRQLSFVVFESEKRPKVEWKNSTKLTITLPAESKVFRQKTTDSGIAIEYAVRDE